MSVVVTTYEWPEALDAVLRGLAGSVRSRIRRRRRRRRIAASTEAGRRAVAAALRGPSHPRLAAGRGLSPRAREKPRRRVGSRRATSSSWTATASRAGTSSRAIRARALPGWFLAGTRLELSERLSEGGPERTDAGRVAGPLAELLCVGVRTYDGWRHLTSTRSPASRGGRGSRTSHRTETQYGFCTAVARADFEAVNGFDMRFVGWGDQDVDLAVRLRRLGLRCGYAGPRFGDCCISGIKSQVAAEPRHWELLQETIASDRIEAVEGLRELACDASRRTGDGLCATRCASPSMKPGVNLVGFLEAESGLGEVARRLAAAIDATDIPLAADPVSRNAWAGAQPTRASLSLTKLPYDTNLICLNADELAKFAPRSAPTSSRRATRSAFGSGRRTCSRRDRAAARFLDEIWVASEYVRDAVRPRSAYRCMSCRSVEPPRTRFRHRAELDLPDGFTFLFVFDFWSGERKNPAAVVEAFTRRVRSRRGPDPRPEEHQRARLEARTARLAPRARRRTGRHPHPRRLRVGRGAGLVCRGV